MYRLFHIMLAGFIGSLAAALVKSGLAGIASERVTGFCQIFTLLVTFYVVNKRLNRLRTDIS